MEFVNPAVFDKVGVIGLCVFCVIALMAGWVVPGRWVSSRLKEKDEQIARRDKTIENLTEVGKTVEAVLVAVKDLAEKRRDE